MTVRALLASAIAAGLLSVGVALSAQEQKPPAPPAKSTPATPTPAAPLNLNTATAAELEKLPGVGPAMAARILEYRQKNGGFKKIEELMNVQGIGEKSFLKLKALVAVAPPKSFDQ
jgi:competence protein ComEA